MNESVGKLPILLPKEQVDSSFNACLGKIVDFMKSRIKSVFISEFAKDEIIIGLEDLLAESVQSNARTELFLKTQISFMQELNQKVENSLKPLN